jgi:hypothetical protein
MAEQWLSIVDYARATGISDMTIRRRIRTGRIKAELKEGKYFIPVDVDYSGEIRRDKKPNHNTTPQMIKNHPGADKTIHAHSERPTPIVRRNNESNESSNYRVAPNRLGFQNNSYSNDANNSWSQVPEMMTRPLVEAGLASVEARALIEFCDRALLQAKSAVQAIEAKYSARIEAMNAHIQNRDQEIKSLNQQIEDLQLLVQILERKKIG